MAARFCSFAFSRLLVVAIVVPAIARAQTVPAWQGAAGGKMAFEVASVREDLSGKWVPPPFSFDADDDFKDTGGLFTADANVATYISFAYKLPIQYNLLAGLPDWAKKENFAIQARAAAHPTKDQMRLMMQSLLEDRFKLALHYETEERPVLVMTLAKPGKLGRGLRVHADGPACTVVTPRPQGAAVTFDMFPCRLLLAINQADGTMLVGARDTTVELMDAFFDNVGHLGRPIVDRTGIHGTIDFSMEYTPEPKSAPAAVVDGQTDLLGTSFAEAIREQLGLKLEPAKASVPVPVIDHVEMPSEN